MRTQLDRALRYRRKAVELRLKAEGSNTETRGLLEQLAEHYEQLARNFEMFERSADGMRVLMAIRLPCVDRNCKRSLSSA
jgi:hypothetical protein